MTREEFESLTYNEKVLVKEGYLDGYRAALECVSTMIQKVGEPIVDNLFVANRDSIALILKSNLDKLNES